MNIPNKIIELVDSFPAEVRPFVFMAVIEYMRSGEIVSGLDECQIQFFMSVKAELDPILRRRRRQAEYRLRRKQQMMQQAGEQTKPSPQPKKTDKVPDSTPNLSDDQNRQQFNALNRRLRAFVRDARRKKLKKHHVQIPRKRKKKH